MAVAALAQKPEPAPPSVDPSPELSVMADEIDRLHEEILALRAQVDKVQSTLDIYVNGMVAELQDENTRLRRLLRRNYGTDLETALPVPTPDRDLVEDALTNPAPAPHAPADPPAPPPVPPAEFSHTVVTEWGRTIEEAARLGDDVQSLKGMIIAVPPGSTDEQLRQLARDLRRQFQAFDNINIEVFETLESAKAFAEGDAAAGQSRVLSISKHSASGRDVAVLIRGERTEELPLEAP
jgi:hypothetical protein